MHIDRYTAQFSITSTPPSASSLTSSCRHIRRGLIDGLVEVLQTAGTGEAAGAFAERFETFRNVDVPGIVALWLYAVDR